MKFGFAAKTFFLELTINISIFSHSKQDKSKRTCKLNWTNLRKLPLILEKKTKLTIIVLPFYHFPARSYTLNKLSDRGYEITLKP